MIIDNEEKLIRLLKESGLVLKIKPGMYGGLDITTYKKKDVKVTFKFYRYLEDEKFTSILRKCGLYLLFSWEGKTPDGKFCKGSGSTLAYDIDISRKIIAFVKEKLNPPITNRGKLSLFD